MALCYFLCQRWALQPLEAIIILPIFATPILKLPQAKFICMQWNSALRLCFVQHHHGQDYLKQTGKITKGRLEEVARLLYRDDRGFANAAQLEVVSEALLLARCPTLNDGEITALVNAGSN